MALTAVTCNDRHVSRERAPLARSMVARRAESSIHFGATPAVRWLPPHAQPGAAVPHSRRHPRDHNQRQPRIGQAFGLCRGRGGIMLRSLGR
jgi:hypothetical protein